MPERPDPEDPRVRRDVVRARRSLLLIFGLGGVIVALVIAWVVRTLPGGKVPSGYLDAPPARPAKPTPRPCARAGDRCEHSPGKLGSCTERPDCAGAGCLFCQSQH